MTAGYTLTAWCAFFLLVCLLVMALADPAPVRQAPARTPSPTLTAPSAEPSTRP